MALCGMTSESDRVSEAKGVVCGSAGKGWEYVLVPLSAGLIDTTLHHLRGYLTDLRSQCSRDHHGRATHIHQSEVVP